MRFCPVCQTRYDEDIIKFCTKDGTPLVEDNPTFTAMPSQAFSAGDIDEETVIRRNNTGADERFSEPERTSERVVVPTFEEKKATVRQLENPSHQQQPPRKSNTGLVVAVTILGTLVVLGGAAVTWLFLRGDDNANKNANSNVNVVANNSNTGNNNGSLANFNTNVNTSSNANANVNTNTNTNANTKTPTPTPTKTPTPTPTPDANSNTNTNTNSNSGNSNVNTNANRPVNNAPSPTPRVSPTPSTQNVNVGIMNSRATSLPKPSYPPIARQQNVSGQVSVQVAVDENGNVLSAKAISGHPLLRSAAENAARQSRFNPVKIGNQNVRANGTIVYSFINN